MKSIVWTVALIVGTATQLDAALTVHTDFESGSAKVLDLNPDTQSIRISPASNPARGLPICWFLRLDGVDPGKPVALDVVALDAPMPPTGNGKPLNPSWTLPIRAVISNDGTNWQQTAPGKRQGNHCVYTVSANSSTLWLAWGPPFTPRDATALVERLGREHAFVKTFTLAKTLEGRDVPGLEIYEGNKPLIDRPAVWVNGRQHAWEVGGSWVAKSFAEWLAGDDEHAIWLRQNAQVIFVPLMDVDHVATGDGGKEALPQDQNRDWTDASHWPEVAAAQKRALAIAKEGRLALYLDVHNPSPGETTPKFYSIPPPYIGEKGATLEDRFLALARENLGEIKIVDEKPSTPENLSRWHSISGPWFHEHGNPETVSLTFEVPWNTPQGTVEGYRSIGEKLGLTVEKYLRDNSTK